VAKNWLLSLRKKDTSRTYNMFIESLRLQTDKNPAAKNQLWQNFLKKELPHKKQEDWKYTDVSFLNKTKFVPDVYSQDVQVFAQSDGVLQITRGPAPKKLPQLKGLTIVRRDAVSQLLKSHSAFVLNSWTYDNYFSDLVNSSGSADLFFVFDASWSSSNVLKLQYLPRQEAAEFTSLGINVVVLPNANVQLHEMLIANESSVLNVASQYMICENAHLTIFKMDQTQKGRLISTSRARVAEDSGLHSVHFTGDASWARHNSYVELIGEAHAELAASYLANTDQFVDHHTFIDHKMPFGTSKQTFSGVLAAKSTGVFNGKVWIHRDAQKSNAEQLSRNLLLAKSAEANVKPELIIDADDVKAKHGATIGQIDEDELFYMQSRGLTPEQSREMVIKSFVFASGDTLPNGLYEIFQTKVVSEVRRFISELKSV
jgi:Fe-S cluster assembly protein SufD